MNQKLIPVAKNEVPSVMAAAMKLRPKEPESIIFNWNERMRNQGSKCTDCQWLVQITHLAAGEDSRISKLTVAGSGRWRGEQQERKLKKLQMLDDWHENNETWFVSVTGIPVTNAPEQISISVNNPGPLWQSELNPVLVDTVEFSDFSGKMSKRSTLCLTGSLMFSWSTNLTVEQIEH